MMDALGIKAQLETVQSNLASSMRCIQAAVMQLEIAEPKFSDTLSALLETHRLPLPLDLNIVDAIKEMKQEVAL